jgi:hypothetical protein
MKKKGSGWVRRGLETRTKIEECQRGQEEEEEEEEEEEISQSGRVRQS